MTEIPAIDIFYKNLNAKPIKYLFGLFTKEPGYEFFGRIRFNGVLSEAAQYWARHWDPLYDRDDNKQTWVFEFWEQKNCEFARQMIEEIASAFNVNIDALSIAGQKDSAWDGGD